MSKRWKRKNVILKSYETFSLSDIRYNVSTLFDGRIDPFKTKNLQRGWNGPAYLATLNAAIG